MPVSTSETVTVLRDFLMEYGKAVSEGDLAAIADCWEVPAFVMADQGARAVGTVSEIEEFFRHASAWYHERGLMSTTGELERIEPLGDRLVSIDVRWGAFDAEGREQQSERSRYVLLPGSDGKLRIRVAISLPDGHGE